MKIQMNVLAVLLVSVVVSQAEAATLLMNYDLGNPASWNGSQIVDLQGFGNNLVPSTASGSIVPQYIGSGASVSAPVPAGKQLRDRAYMDFQDLGYIVGSGRNPQVFNNPTYNPGCTTCGSDSAQGYSMEGFFYFDSAFAAETNTGIGFTQQTSAETQMIRNNGTTLNLRSQSTYDTSNNGTGLLSVDQNLNGFIPTNQWFHFIKVHDADPDGNLTTDGGEVRYYINGQLVAALTQDFDTAIDTDNIAGNAQRYHNRGENLAGFGTSTREMSGLGFSMVSFYQGALTDAEALAAFQSASFVNAVPEPSSALLLGLGLVMLRAIRRKQRS